MKFSSRACGSARVVCLAFAAALALTAQANAAEVTFTGSATGAFGVGSPSNTAVLSPVGGGQLNYYGSSFNGTTANGFLAFGGNAVASYPGNQDNLGSMNLTSTAASYSGNTFTLLLTFTAPAGISGGQSQTFAANLTGQVVNTTTGGVFIDFDNTPRTISFNNMSTGPGLFTLAVNDISLNPGQLIALSGTITSASSTPVGIPEPGSLLLLGSGLIGFSLLSRRYLKRP